MKCCFISDLHFGTKKTFDIFIENQFNFIINQFIPYARENDIKDIFILGDLFDNRNNLNNKVMNSTIDLFDKHFRDFNVYMIVGNHDSYLNSSIDTNWLKIFSEFKNITVIDKLTEIKLGDKNITMVPWITDREAFETDFIHRYGDVCLGHFDIKGFRFNKTVESDVGISEDLFKHYTKTFTGHFHSHSSKIFNGNEIVYLGSPYQITRADKDEKRGFVVLDLDNLSYEFIENKISAKFVNIKFPETFDKNTVKNNIVDIYVDYEDAYKEDEIDLYIKNVNDCEPLYPATKIVDYKEMSENKLEDLNISLTIPDLLNDYVNTLELENKDIIYKNILELYEDTKVN